VPDMSSPLPPIPTQARSSLFHQAATVSAWLPLVLVGVQIFLVGPLTASSSDPLMREFFAFAMGSALLLGLVLGIVGLCGISKYGTKGLLVKSIIGIVIPLLLVLLAIPPILHAREIALRVAQRQAALSAPGGPK